MIEDGANESEPPNGGLMGQTVLSRMADRIRAQDHERLERVSLPALCFALGLPVMVYFDRHGSPGRGDVAAIFIGVMVVVSWAQRSFRSHAWYWSVIAGLAFLHAAIWLFIPSHWDASRGSIGVIGYGDFFGSGLIFILFERKFARRRQAVAK